MNYFLFICFLFFSSCSSLEHKKGGFYLSKVGIIETSTNKKFPGVLTHTSGWVLFANNIIGSIDKNGTWLTSFSLKNYTHNWWYELKAPLGSAVANDSSHIYLGFQNGKIEKLDANNSKLIWAQELDGGIFRSMVIEKDDIFVITSKNTLYRIDKKTGKTKWYYEFDTTKHLQISGQASAKIIGNYVYVIDCEEVLYCLYADTGKKFWQINLAEDKNHKSDLSGSIGDISQVGNNIIFSLYSGKIFLVNIQAENLTPKKRIIWKKDILEHSVMSFTSKGEDSYIGAHRGNKNYIYKIENISGEIKWKQKVLANPLEISLNEQSVLVSGSNGFFQVLKQANGELLFHQDLRSSVTKPLFYKKNIYLPLATGSIYVYKKAQKLLFY